MKALILAVAMAWAIATGPIFRSDEASAASGDLVIGLQDDPDVLDPVLSWSFVSRHVLQSLCDKLVDVDEQGNFVPGLATSWAWSNDITSLTLKLRSGVVFHDGTPFDAEAVRFNIERSQSLKGTRRRVEIDGIAAIETPDAATVVLKLSRPSVTLLAAMADRAGMMISPTAAKAAGEDFFKKPVCAGPYTFVEHKAQDRIVLSRFDKHWRAADYHFERLIFRGMSDTNVRLVNLKSNQLQLIERLAPTDVAQVSKDPTLKVVEAPTLGYFGITFNVGNGDARNADIARSKLVREAIDLAIDRAAINQVVFDGHFEPGNQPVPPSNPYYDRSKPVPVRDVARAKARLKEAGIERLKFELLVPTDPQRQQVAELLQSMLAEAGIEVVVQQMELMSLLARAKDGKFQAHLVGWSGRIDPDLNVSPLLGCTSGGNDGKYCSEALEAALATARSVADPQKRKELYKPVFGILLDERPISYLYHGKWIFASRAGLKGFKGYSDGVIRMEGATLGN